VFCSSTTLRRNIMAQGNNPNQPGQGRPNTPGQGGQRQGQNPNQPNQPGQGGRTPDKRS
jgi:hypothetical protein